MNVDTHKPEFTKVSPVAQMPGEPNDQELRDRVRKWMWHFMRVHNLSQRELADALDMKEPTISTHLRGLSDPGVDCFVRMHFRFRESLDRMATQDPPLPTRAAAPITRDYRRPSAVRGAKK